jgi:glycosyltransferase involved in cell wall biosynthesis
MIDPLPLVTIYIPTKNRLDLFTRALNSALNQNYPDIEIIVVDDGSDPGIQEQLQSHCALLTKVTLILNTVSRGACVARNQALAVAKGEFITGLDDDDEFTPDRVRQFVTYWQKHPNYSYLCSGYFYVIKGGKKLKSWRPTKTISYQNIMFSNEAGNQVFTKTCYMKQLGGFDADLVACQDYDLWIRLSANFGTAFRLYSHTYIVHEEHDFPRISSFEKRWRGHQQLIDKYIRHWSQPQLKSQLFFQALYSGERDLARLWKLASPRHYFSLLKYAFNRLRNTK